MGYALSNERTIGTRWGDVDFRLVNCRKNGTLTTMIVYLPHFSQIKLMRREKCRPQVIRICRAIAEALRQP